MAHSFNKNLVRKEQHTGVSLGIFFITLGVALLIATNDLLNFGSINRYFTWETVLIFIGVILLLNLHFTGGILMIAGGFWFLRDEINMVLPQNFDTFYWPGVIILIGLAYILSSLFRRFR
jgi:hypothetical protein